MPRSNPAIGECRAEGRHVFGDAPPIGAWGDDHDAEVIMRPAPGASRHHRHNAPLSIDRGQEVLHIHDTALDLDDQQCARVSVPGEDVHRATLAVSTERELGDRLPASGGQQGCDSFDEGRVLPVA